MEKKKLSLKDIGIPKLVMMFAAGFAYPAFISGIVQRKRKGFGKRQKTATESSDLQMMRIRQAIV